jgi:xanthine dehydrogenase small subunit
VPPCSQATVPHTVRSEVDETMVERFLRPASPAEAVQLQQETGGAFLAGGTELNYRGASSAEVVVSLDRLGLDFVREEPEAVLLGQGITLQEIADSKVLAAAGLGLLCDAARAVGSRAIRCQATLGGNVAANKSCSDLIPPLMVLGASVVLVTPSGEHEEPIEQRVAVADRHALITAIRVPRPRPSARLARQRFSRTVNDLATINLALGFRLEHATITEPRLAIGGVAPTVVRIAGAEAVLAGASPSADRSSLAERLGDALRSGVSPIDDLRGSSWFKTELAVALGRRALESALAPEGGSR